MTPLLTRLDINKDFLCALELMESDAPFVFVTGRAGTGKSTLLRHFRATTKQTCAYLAPTGVAALNIEGETIHSFFRFSPGISVKDAKRKGAAAQEELYNLMDSIVIDEISMVRADLMDCMDAFLRAALHRQEPFGGKRLIVIGDLYQLPPVVTSHERAAFTTRYDTPYFFSSDAVQGLVGSRAVAFIELEKVYRQEDASFLGLLNGIRNRSITPEQLARVNARVTSKPSVSSEVICLTTTNATADHMNEEELSALPGAHTEFKGIRKGDFPEKDLPTDETLRLKKGARVMCVANDTNGAYVNGSLGIVARFKKDHVHVRLDDGPTVEVTPHIWTIYRSTYRSGAKHLEQEKLGSFSQVPLRLAWAVTIHKSQGKTFDRVMIDLERGAFAAGQVYVALSRCRTLGGICLVRPVTLPQLRLDYRVVKFLTSLQYALANQAQTAEEKLALLYDAIARQQTLTMTYLKAKDEKSLRKIRPLAIEEDEFEGHEFLALRAHCYLRGTERTFNVARILRLGES